MKRTTLTVVFLCILLMASKSQAEITPGIPDTIDPDRHYLFYLHGQIVEGSDGWPSHPDHGTYEYPKIVDRLAEEGFWVISEIRRKNTDPMHYAGLVSFYVDELKKAGVPSSNITILGASKGGIIACYVSNKQQDKDLNFVIMAGFFDSLKNDPHMLVYGRVLSIHDSSDQNKINPKYFLGKSPGVTRERVVITKNHWGHGLIFQPRTEWLKEVFAWSGIHEPGKSK